MLYFNFIRKPSNFDLIFLKFYVTSFTSQSNKDTNNNISSHLERMSVTIFKA